MTWAGTTIRERWLARQGRVLAILPYDADESLYWNYDEDLYYDYS